jgi:hypothetical protein
VPSPSAYSNTIALSLHCSYIVVLSKFRSNFLFMQPENKMPSNLFVTVQHSVAVEFASQTCTC